MKKLSWVSALAVSAAVASVVSADITGNVKIDGPVPEAKEIDMAADAGCKAQHADPALARETLGQLVGSAWRSAAHLDPTMVSAHIALSALRRQQILRRTPPGTRARRIARMA